MTNYHNNSWIMQRLQEHYNIALSLYPLNRIVGIFVQGSQNYNLDTSKSDLDSYLIIMPSAIELIAESYGQDLSYQLDNEEHITIRELRTYFNLFEQQDINTLEILFTHYRIINPIYEELWQDLLTHKNTIANSTPYALMQNNIDHVMSHYNEIIGLIPPLKPEEVYRYGYSPKRLHHFMRYIEFYNNFDKTHDFEQSLLCHNITIKNIKLCPPSKEHALQIANQELIKFNEMLITLSKVNLTQSNLYHLFNNYTQKFFKIYLDEAQYII